MCPFLLQMKSINITSGKQLQSIPLKTCINMAVFLSTHIQPSYMQLTLSHQVLSTFKQTYYNKTYEPTFLQHYVISYKPYVETAIRMTSL